MTKITSIGQVPKLFISLTCSSLECAHNLKGTNGQLRKSAIVLTEESEQHTNNSLVYRRPGKPTSLTSSCDSKRAYQYQPGCRHDRSPSLIAPMQTLLFSQYQHDTPIRCFCAFAGVLDEPDRHNNGFLCTPGFARAPPANA